MKRELTLSIVIPVYNEERYIKACLDAIAAQTVKPLEVIVVDNNCTDQTVELAKTYDFVKILKEPIQGRTVSRNRGFNATRGDIIGRIDADSVIMPGWVDRLLVDFEDTTVSGVTGLAKTRVIIGLKNWLSTFWSRGYYWAMHSYFGVNTMWGANMAIRRSMWLQIRNSTAPNGMLVHEDHDLSLELLAHGGKIVQDNKLLIYTVGASYSYWPKFWSYLKKTVTMKRFHQKKGTFDKLGNYKLSIWRNMPGAFLGLLVTILFIIYALLVFPIMALLYRFSPRFRAYAR